MNYLKVKPFLHGVKKIAQIVLIAFIGIVSMALGNNEPLLVLDSKPNTVLPNQLRIVPNYHGLAGIAGSAQFNQAGLEAILTKIRLTSKKPINKIWLIDLRQETHFFANGMPSSLYGYHNHANLNKTADQIQEEESILITQLNQKAQPSTVHLILDKSDGIIQQSEPLSINLQNSISEEKLAETYNLAYKRFYIADHQAPSSDTLLEIKKFIEQLNSEDWVIVHCRGGKGRTTTFMLLTALLQDKKNHPEEKLNSLESYIQEQISLGGSDLFSPLSNPPSHSKGGSKEWKKEYMKNRFDFIRIFYNSL